MDEAGRAIAPGDPTVGPAYSFTGRVTPLLQESPARGLRCGDRAPPAPGPGQTRNTLLSRRVDHRHDEKTGPRDNGETGIRLNSSSLRRTTS